MSIIFCLQELFPGSKYKMKNEADVYTLIINTPKVDDTGKYSVEIAGIACHAFLNVDGKLSSLKFFYSYIHT